jgi:hypothetical protein
MAPRISLLILLLAISTLASAKKWIMPLEAMASQADYMVVGEIVSVQDSTYLFHVAEYVKGTGSRTLTVQQFKEWTCDQRYAKPAKGQRLFLFLKHHNADLELLNGSSGELPISNNRITLENEVYTYERGKPFVPYSIDLPEFKTGLRLLVRCFSVQVTPLSFYRSAAVQLGSAKEVEVFRSTSLFTGWLYERIKTRYVVAVESSKKPGQ